nr:unnamed protein product [Callosobruchus analis]
MVLWYIFEFKYNNRKMNTIHCDICNDESRTMLKASAEDNNFINYLTKLHCIAPELVWSPNTNICTICISDLEIAYKFKQVCLKSGNFGKITKYDADTSEHYETDPLKYDSHNECSDCNINFDTQEQQELHLNQKQCNDNDTQNPKKYERLEECLKCGRKFALTSSLEKHELSCDGIIRHRKVSNKHQCDKCKRFYTTSKILSAHKKACKLKNDKKTEHQCEKCHTYYVSQKTLKDHHRRGCKIDFEDTNSEQICDICSKPFSSSFLLKKHVAEYHKMCKCEDCGVSFTDYKQFITHMNSEHAKMKLSRKFTCEICTESFSLLKTLLQHCHQSHSIDVKYIKPYHCDICNHKFASSSNLMNHKMYHDGLRPNICSFCGKSFITKNDLSVHEKTHFGERNFECNTCNKTFKTNANLRTHCLVAHTDPSLWKYVCYVCNKRFPQKSNHDQHVKRHTGEKNFICSLCIKSFTSKSELLEHIRYHSNERSFKCQICGKAYRKRYSYNIHLKKVHNIGNAKIAVREKKYACHICPGKFHDKPKLARHLCTHSGIKPFGCSFCEKRFTDKSYLNLHVKLNHSLLEKTTESQDTPL